MTKPKLVFPNKLIIIYPGSKWKYKSPLGEELLAFPAWAVDPNHLGMIHKATEWAKNKDYKNGFQVQQLEIDNTPRKARIFAYEERNYSSVLKVIIDEFVYDLRFDTFLDTLYKDGMDAGGYCKGEFIWARNGAHMRLVHQLKPVELEIQDILS